MSSIPKARQSTCTGLTVKPDEWDAYPEVSRSTITNCTFENLNSSTEIERTELTQSILGVSSAKSKRNSVQRSVIDNSHILSSQIERSQLSHCSITDARVQRSHLEHCTVLPQNHVERTTARATKFIGSKLVERSELDDTVVLGASTVARSVVKNAVIADRTTCERSECHDVVITRSRIERSTLRNCDVMDCVIERTEFEGLILKYGIWKNGDLVGRTAKEEVVIKPRLTPDTTTTVRKTEPDPPSQGLPAPRSPPASTREPGWKAAEAARERLVDLSDQEDPLSSDDDALTDDDIIGPGSKSTGRVLKNPSTTAIADAADPPPPYEK